MVPLDSEGRCVPNSTVGAPRPRYWVDVGVPELTEPPSTSKVEPLAIPKLPRAWIVPPLPSTKILPEEKLCFGSTRTVPLSTNLHLGQGGSLATPALPKPPPTAT